MSVQAIFYVNEINHRATGETDAVTMAAAFRTYLQGLPEGNGDTVEGWTSRLSGVPCLCRQETEIDAMAGLVRGGSTPPPCEREQACSRFGGARLGYTG